MRLRCSPSGLRNATQLQLNTRSSHLASEIRMATDADTWYARPVFFVADCEEALLFYTGLGFAEDWRHEEEGALVAVQVTRSGAELILNRNRLRAGGGRLFLSLQRGQAAKCVEQFLAAGAEVRDDHWGMPVKAVSDPDGNDLLLTDDDLTLMSAGEPPPNKALQLPRPLRAQPICAADRRRRSLGGFAWPSGRLAVGVRPVFPFLAGPNS
jgi:catechol 2,3-dioxygenase-like lactoylglutathione lyase family enzyme